MYLLWVPSPWPITPSFLRHFISFNAPALGEDPSHTSIWDSCLVLWFSGDPCLALQQPAVWAAAINSDSSLWAPIQTLGVSFKKWSESPSIMSTSLQPHGLYSPWNSPHQNSGLAFPPPGDLPNQGSNPDLLHHRRILYQLSHRAVPNYSHLRCPKVGRYSLPTSPASPGGPRTKNRPDDTTGDWTPQIVYAYLLYVWESAPTCLRPDPKWLFVEWMNAPMEVSWVFLSKWVSTLSDYSLPPFPALPGTEPPQC